MSNISQDVRAALEDAKKLESSPALEMIFAAFGVSVLLLLPGAAMAGLYWLWFNVSPYLAILLYPYALIPWLIFYWMFLTEDEGDGDAVENAP